MLRKLAVLCLAVASLAAASPAAVAGHAPYDCGFDSWDPQSDHTYDGVAYGWATDPAGGYVSIRCSIVVNGSWVAATPTGSGGTVAVTAGRVSFFASPTDDVKLCLVATDSRGTWSTCYQATNNPFPPQMVNDLVDAAVAGVDAVVAVVASVFACGDGIDNDGDGWTDHPADPDCSDAFDNTEGSSSSGCSDLGGVQYCAALTPDTEYARYDVAGGSSTSLPVAGYIDAYEFTMPNSGAVTLPCVVLVHGGQTDPCGLAGGRFVRRDRTLVQTSVSDPGGPRGAPLASVRVCHADLVLTADGYGLSRFATYAVC